MQQKKYLRKCDRKNCNYLGLWYPVVRLKTNTLGGTFNIYYEVFVCNKHMESIYLIELEEARHWKGSFRITELPVSVPTARLKTDFVFEMLK